ncbi:hypothetical protein ACFU99_07855 [Streptomyces sp. NPDC057654]
MELMEQVLRVVQVKLMTQVKRVLLMELNERLPGWGTRRTAR